MQVWAVHYLLVRVGLHGVMFFCVAFSWFLLSDGSYGRPERVSELFMSVSTLADCQYFVTVNNHHDQTLHTTNPTISKVVKTPDFSKSRKLDMGPEMTVVNPSPRRAIPAKSKLSSARVELATFGCPPLRAGHVMRPTL